MTIKRGLSTAILLAGVLAAAPLFAGPTITLRGEPLTLLGKTVAVGDPLPVEALTASGLKNFDAAGLKDKVSVVSVVPSIDTAVCEKQTHILSEENGGLDQTANLVTISRDLPFAQKRFAKAAHMENILFLSDYRTAEFGKAAGLLIDESRLLARAVMVLDRQGVVRYLEIVPDLGQLPDMHKAFEFARGL
jgi:thiol peroxidase